MYKMKQVGKMNQAPHGQLPIYQPRPCSLGGIWRNLDESGGICERMNSAFHPRTVKSGWFFNQPNEPYIIFNKMIFEQI